MSEAAARRAIEAVWRIESARVTAALARMLRDFGLAEEMAQEALVAALEQWPAAGVPENPGAWLTAVGKRRAIDRIRRDARLAEKQTELARAARDAALGPEEARVEDVGDDMLRLVFTACHPALSPEARVALTLKVVGGLKTEEIARAFLVPEATIAQRVVRAKRTLGGAGVRFEVPDTEELTHRLASVLEVVYLIFNEGYTATSGKEWFRPALCEEALRLGRVIAGLIPNDPEAHGLVALMEIQASRIRARLDAEGRPVKLMDQDRSRWDRILIGRGLAALERAELLGGLGGSYALQAAIAACHARARSAEETDWGRIAGLYDRLAAMDPSPVVELNRAVAHSMAYGPRTALQMVDALAAEPRMAGYHLLASVRADLLARMGHTEEARSEFRRAASLTRNAAERDLLLQRAGGD